jgi:hypothetical protein
MNRSLRNDRAVERQENTGREIGTAKTPYRTFRRWISADRTRIWDLSDKRAFLTAVGQSLDDSNNRIAFLRPIYRQPTMYDVTVRVRMINKIGISDARLRVIMGRPICEST